MTESSPPLDLTSPSPDTHPHWLAFPPTTANVHFGLGIVLSIFGVLGVIGNSLVLFVFTRFRRLRGPFSAFIVNLAVADLITSLLHIMVAASSFNGAWMFGQIGCQFYAFGVGLSGMNSIVTLTVIAVERYTVITAKPLSASWRITQLGAMKMICGIWVYCLTLTVPPLCGWSRFIQEGFLTSCSWDYISRTPLNRSYYLYLLIFGFVGPVIIITYCYIFIMAAIIAHGREMRAIKATVGGPQGACNYHSSGASQVVSTARNSRIANTFRSAYIIIMLVILFVISWTPYAIVTFIAQFGDVNMITPWVATIPALFAKASVIYNPFVYGLSHPHFRSTLKSFMTSACQTRTTHGARGTSDTPGRRRAANNTFELREFHPDPEAIPARSCDQPVRCCPSHPPGQRVYYSEPVDPQVKAALDRQPRETTVHWQPPVQVEICNENVRRSISGPTRGGVYGASSAHVHQMYCFRGRACCVTQTSATAATTNQASSSSGHRHGSRSSHSQERAHSSHSQEQSYHSVDMD